MKYYYYSINNYRVKELGEYKSDLLALHALIELKKSTLLRHLSFKDKIKVRLVIDPYYKLNIKYAKNTNDFKDWCKHLYKEEDHIPQQLIELFKFFDLVNFENASILRKLFILKSCFNPEKLNLLNDLELKQYFIKDKLEVYLDE